MHNSIINRYMLVVLLFMALGSNIATGLVSVSIGLGIAGFVFIAVKTKKIPTFNSGFLKVITIFSLVILLESLLSEEQWRSFHAAVSTICRFIPFFLAAIYIKNRRQLEIMLLCLAVSVLINDSTAVYQVLTHKDCGWGIGRPTGLVKSPTHLGSFMLMALPILFLSAKHIRKKIVRYFIYLTGVTSLITLFLTQTRGAWIAFVLTIVLLFIINQQYRKIIGIIVVAMTIGVTAITLNSSAFQSRFHGMINPADGKNTERVLMWKSAFQIWKDHPLFGIGQDEFGLFYNSQYISPKAKERPESPDKPRTGHGHPHNNIMKVLSENGLVGLSAYLLLHGYFLYRLILLYRGSEKNSWQHSLALAGILMFAGIHLEGMTDTNIMLTHIMREYWLLMGLIFATEYNKFSLIDNKGDVL